jgi:hypothetical protein
MDIKQSIRFQTHKKKYLWSDRNHTQAYEGYNDNYKQKQDRMAHEKPFQGQATVKIMQQN